MTDPDGGFYSTQDADSGGEEGKYFLWTPDELRAVLGDEAHDLMRAYGVTPQGNFEGKNILELVGSLDDRERFAAARRKLLAHRARRVPPARDEKVLASWNGLMLATFAEAGRTLDPGYGQVAERNANFLLHHLMTDEWRLFPTWKALLKLAGLAVETQYIELAEESLAGVHSFLGQYPLGFGQWLVALDYALSRPREIAIVGTPGADDTRALLEAATRGYRPHQVVAVGNPGQEVAAEPLLADRPAVDGHAAAHVCHNFACQAPVTEPEGLPALLAGKCSIHILFGTEASG